jgi:hypothetical protein
MLLNGQIANEATYRNCEKCVIKHQATKAFPSTEKSKSKKDDRDNGTNVPRYLKTWLVTAGQGSKAENDVEDLQLDPNQNPTLLHKDPCRVKVGNRFKG